MLNCLNHAGLKNKRPPYLFPDRVVPAVSVTVLHFTSLHSLDVSRLTIPYNAKCSPNRGLWRTPTHKTSRNWPFGPAFNPHKLRPPEWAVAAAEIWPEKTDINLVRGLKRDSRLKERLHVGEPSNTDPLAIKTYHNTDDQLSGTVVPALHHFFNCLSQYECCVVGTTECG